MAIKINNTTVIDDSRNALNINSIVFADATTQTTAGSAGSSSIGDTVVAGETLLQTLLNPISNPSYFGFSVDISGNYAIIGAYQDDNPNTDSGKAYIFDVTTGALVWTLNNPNAYSTSAFDFFGYSVAISGNYVIVGAYSEDDAGGEASGKAYIYNVATGTLLYTLSNPNAYGTGTSDYFGYNVAISGNYAIVGASSEDDAGGADSGKAYIFDVTTGQLVWTLNNPNAYSTSAGDRFGGSVAISGNYAIVGAYGEDDTGGTESGKAYIFDITTGQLVHTLTNPNAYSTSAGDIFGESVAISDNYALVGAYAEDSNGSNSGAAYIFNVTNGQLIRSFYGDAIYTSFGSAVSLSDKYVVIGNPGYLYMIDWGAMFVYDVNTGEELFFISTYEDDAAFGRSVAVSGEYVISGAPFGYVGAGAAYIYNIGDIIDASQIEQISFTTGAELNLLTDKLFQTAHVGGELIHTLNNPNVYSTSVDDNFGLNVDISGNYAIVGAYHEDEPGSNANSGKAYIFDVTTGQLLHTLNNPNAYGTANSDGFGLFVAISGNYAIVGASNENSASGTNSGAAYIFNVTTGALVWTLNNPNAYSTSAGDFFGFSVGISGNYAIVGADGEDDAGGADSGKAYIYNVTTGALLYTLSNPNAYGTGTSDYFGISVSISGNYAIVGAYGEDDAGGADSGKAYIYNVSTGQLVWTLSNPNAYSTSAGDYFGRSVAISGNYAIVGAYSEDDTGGSASGKAYIFDVTTGALVWTLTNPTAYGTSAGDYFGESVAISDNYALVGAYGEDDAGGAGSGKSYIFNVSTGQLLYTLSNPNAYSTSASDYFGDGAAISGNYAIVGAYSEDDTGGSASGKAYIFSVSNQTYLDKIVTVGNSIY